jgi:RNA polymerase sigma factor (sigma-70 family)
MTFQSEDFIPTRYSLLSRLKNWDDQDSWKEFFDTYWRLIYSVALKSGLTEAEAQDVVQETIISVAKSIHKFKKDRELGSFKGWLRNLTRWRIADQLRKRTRVTSLDQEAATEEFYGMDMAGIPESAEAESVWENEWRLNLLKVALANVKRQVKEEHFQIFDFYVVRQWPVAQVMRTLGVSAGQVYLVKFRVGALIKKEIRRLENSEIRIE